MNKDLAKALARLTGLKNNLPQGWTEIKYSTDFNEVIHKLEELVGEDLSDFKYPSHMSHVIPGHRGIYCDKNFLLVKIDGVLGYFNLILQPVEDAREIGFRVSEQ
jgi:hypothetical protein